jgi:hypothetical protein
MRYFVENSCDKYGNRAYTNSKPQVVEGEVIGDGIGAELVFNPESEIAKSWPSVMFNLYNGWTEVDGPARMLTWEEREDLIVRCAKERGRP